ncbi:MAG: ABC transporter ATP-binding protein [Nitrospiraceae bacterium]|nr:ABC transporter ATP-binding protein [Nitrospiraceae bacterium]
MDRIKQSGQQFIDLRGVRKGFWAGGTETTVLKDIDLAVSAGEYVAIVGKSGSGKSTLLNMITGIDHPSEGSVRFGSIDVQRLDESSLAAWRGKNIGIVFQFFQLIPTITVRENILLAMDFVGKIPRHERNGRAEALLSMTGIAAHADKLPSSLSGGEQQRVAIARALANDPPLLVADEPTGNLDSATAEAIQQLFADLVKEGKTVLVVTHEDVDNAGYRRIITMRDGTIIGDAARN